MINKKSQEFFSTFRPQILVQSEKNMSRKLREIEIKCDKMFRFVLKTCVKHLNTETKPLRTRSKSMRKLRNRN